MKSEQTEQKHSITLILNFNHSWLNLALGCVMGIRMLWCSVTVVTVGDFHWVAVFVFKLIYQQFVLFQNSLCFFVYVFKFQEIHKDTFLQNDFFSFRQKLLCSSNKKVSHWYGLSKMSLFNALENSIVWKNEFYHFFYNWNAKRKDLKSKVHKLWKVLTLSCKVWNFNIYWNTLNNLA